MTEPKLPHWVKESLEDRKAQDIRVFPVSHLTTITDFMVVCSGTSNIQIKAIANRIIDAAKKSGERPLGVEGLDYGEWVLVDLGDIIVHIMHPKTRSTYDLEKLWDFTKAKRSQNEN